MKKYLLTRGGKIFGFFFPVKTLAFRLLDVRRNKAEAANGPCPAEGNKSQNAPQKTEKGCQPPLLLRLAPFLPFKQKPFWGLSTWKIYSRVPAIKNTQATKQLKENPDISQENRREAGKLSGKRKWNAAAILVGFILCGFLVEKLVNGWEEGILVGKGTAMPLSVGKLKEKTADKFYQNALVRTITPPVTKEKKNHLKPANLKDIRRQVAIKSNGYTVGYFGGISGLMLTVSNGSDQFINQVEVEIHYLERNGSVIETQTYQIRALKPHSFQTLSVPATTKGAKVAYKIMNIYSRQHRSLLKEI